MAKRPAPPVSILGGFCDHKRKIKPMANILVIQRITEYASHMSRTEVNLLADIHDRLDKYEKAKKVKRSFMWLYAIIAWLAILATIPAWSEPVSVYGAQSTVDFTTSDEPGAVGEVRFRNYLEISQGPIEVLTLDYQGVSVMVDFAMGPHDTPDTMTVFPPFGYMAVPQVVDVAEGETGVVVIYPIEGVGM